MLDISPVKSPEGGQRQTPGRDLGGEPPAAAELPPRETSPRPVWSLHLRTAQRRGGCPPSWPHLAPGDPGSPKTKAEEGYLHTHVHHRIIHNSQQLEEGEERKCGLSINGIFFSLTLREEA